MPSCKVTIAPGLAIVVTSGEFVAVKHCQTHIVPTHSQPVNVIVVLVCFRIVLPHLNCDRLLVTPKHRMLDLHASIWLQQTEHAGRWWQTEATNTPWACIFSPVGCTRADMPFAAEASPAVALDATNASARLVGSTGREVHIVGVSHTSPFYGSIAADAISSASPRQVVLEVCEVWFGSGISLTL